jgi:hypothetical protein
MPRPPPYPGPADLFAAVGTPEADAGKVGVWKAPQCAGGARVVRAMVADVAARPLAVGCSELPLSMWIEWPRRRQTARTRSKSLGLSRVEAIGVRRYAGDGVVSYFATQEIGSTDKTGSAPIIALITPCASPTAVIMHIINRPGGMPRGACWQGGHDQRVGPLLSRGIINLPSWY